jgi:SAM-dependent methyltransferase
MTYRPGEFWEERLRTQFDLSGTGETGLSLAYNRACYRLRGDVLTAALREAGMDPAGRAVLDVGCGTGFFTELYLRRGAKVTGIDITPTSVARLSERFPAARFIQADVSEAVLPERYAIVNAFDVLYHITDESRWENAVRNLAAAVEPGGLLLLTDAFADVGGQAEHNRMRSLSRYRPILGRCGISIERLHPTHVLLNRSLGPFRFLNRAPGLLYWVDRTLLGLGLGRHPVTNRILVGRRTA